MSTVELVCCNCGSIFNKRKHEYEHRTRKYSGNVNWFCNLSCNAQYRNANRLTKPKGPGPQYGNKFGRKYKDGMGWYVSRCANDRRFIQMDKESRKRFSEQIYSKWVSQQGKCAITGINLILRNRNGSCDTSNPFKIASLDRIDANTPYVVDNVRWVSLAMNLARQQIPVGEFDQYYQELMEIQL